MERARATWTDERLDDLSQRVETGFTRLDEELRQLRTEIHARFDAAEGRLAGRIDAVEEKVGTRIGGLEDRIDNLQRTMIQVASGIFVALLATIVTVVATNV